MYAIIDARKHRRKRRLEYQQEVLLGLLIIHIKAELLIKAIHCVHAQVLNAAVHHQLEQVRDEFRVAP
jgi:hypothetical protein